MRFTRGGRRGERGGVAAPLSPGAQCDVATRHVRWQHTPGYEENHFLSSFAAYPASLVSIDRLVRHHPRLCRSSSTFRDTLGDYSKRYPSRKITGSPANASAGGGSTERRKRRRRRRSRGGRGRYRRTEYIAEKAKAGERGRERKRGQGDREVETGGYGLHFELAPANLPGGLGYQIRRVNAFVFG